MTSRLVGQAHLGDLAKRRVRLLRRGRVDTRADTALLRVLLHRGDLALGLHRFAALADQMVDCRHENLFTLFSERTRLSARRALPGRLAAKRRHARKGRLAPYRNGEANSVAGGRAICPARHQAIQPGTRHTSRRTLHPRRLAPGYFDGCPESDRSNRESPCERIAKGRDITGNVQLYLAAGGNTPDG